MISLSSISSPVLLLSTAHIALVRILELRIVTLGAFTTTAPLMSLPSTTVPAVLIVSAPLGVSVVPAGTPVFDASGKADGGGVAVGVAVGVVVGVAVGVGVGVADASTRSNDLVCVDVRLR